MDSSLRLCVLSSYLFIRLRFIMGVSTFVVIRFGTFLRLFELFSDVPKRSSSLGMAVFLHEVR